MLSDEAKEIIKRKLILITVECCESRLRERD